MPLGRNTNGSMLGETIVALVVIAVLMPVALRLHMKSAETRIERASLERMSELAADLLGEARLADCAGWQLGGDLNDPTNPSDDTSPCFVPLAVYQGATVQAIAPICDADNDGNADTDANGDPVGGGVAFTHDHRTFEVVDCRRTEHTIRWPVRTVAITDSTGRLTLTRSAVGRPSPS